MIDCQQVSTFISRQKLAVIATSALSPEAALVATVVDDALRVYFQTGEHTRKAHNLVNNSAVAFVFGLQLSDMVTVQYEGVARRLSSTSEIKRCKQCFIDQNSPTTKKYLNHSSAIFFEVVPTWVGYSDYRSSSPKVIELTEFTKAHV